MSETESNSLTREDDKMQTWNTDAADFAQAIKEFEIALPGFWWSAGQCSVGAHASCAVDSNGVQAYLLSSLVEGEDSPIDSGFHCDTDKGTPGQALRDVMCQALDWLEENAD